MTEPTPLEALSLELVGIPSVIGNEAAIADFVQQRLHAVGPHRLERAGHNLAMVPRAFRQGVPRLMLLGHLDTVPVSDANPPRMESDRLHGLGASDMKCADALMMLLAERACATPPDVDLIVVLYASEEGPYEQSGMPEIIAAAPDLFENVDLAVAMEPTDNQIELGCLGTLHAWVHITGQRAHSARPWEGSNAIHAAAPLLEALRTQEPRVVMQDGLEFKEVCSVTLCDFEGARNVIPGRFSLNINFRFGPDRTRDQAQAWIRAFVREHLGDSGVEIEIADVCPSGRVCGTNPLLARLEAAAGDTVLRRAKQAWTDVGRLSELGMDAVNFGPGSGSQAHQVGEWCSRKQLARSHEILNAMLWPTA